MCNDTAAATTSNCLMDGTDPYYRISTLVSGPRGTSANTQIYVSGGVSFNPECAITVATDLEIPGTANITGDQDCVHSNADVIVGGVPTSIGQVRAVGSVTDTTKIAAGGGSSAPGQSAVTLPVINPADFKSYADYVFESDGHIYDSLANDLGTSWQGWSRTSTSPDIWTKGDSSPSDPGLYYIEGNVEISGSVGSAGTLWESSLIATKSIQISGESYFQNYHNPDAGFPEGVNNIFMMAGRDLEYNGNPTVNVQGIIAVGEEIKINGNPSLEGYLIVNNTTDPGDPSGYSDHIDKNEMSGNFSLYFDSSLSLTSPWSQGVNRITWRSIGQ